MIEKILERLRGKFNYNSEQAEIWREGSDKDAYFREKKDLYLDRANTYGEAISIVQEVAKEYMHSCYDCEWECLDGCSLRRDSNGNREPVYDGLTDCKDFVPKDAPYQKGE